MTEQWLTIFGSAFSGAILAIVGFWLKVGRKFVTRREVERMIDQEGAYNRDCKGIHATLERLTQDVYDIQHPPAEPDA